MCANRRKNLNSVLNFGILIGANNVYSLFAMSLFTVFSGITIFTHNYILNEGIRRLKHIKQSFTHIFTSVFQFQRNETKTGTNLDNSKKDYDSIPTVIYLITGSVLQHLLLILTLQLFSG